MEVEEKDDAKSRILSAAEQLFSEKGFDATRVSDISDAARVNKALIYYYFKNKEAVLDHLLKSLLDDVTAASLDFIQKHVVRLIGDGRLDILHDRFHFASAGDLQGFLGSVRGYYDKLIDYAVARKSAFRILMLESLKKSKHQFDLYRFLDLFKSVEDNPLYKAINDADRDFSIPGESVVYQFFFTLLPIMGFASYFEDWNSLEHIDKNRLKEIFLAASDSYLNTFVCGQDLMTRQSLLAH